MKTYQVAFLAASLFLLTVARPTHADHPEIEGFFPAAGGPITVQPTSGPIQVGGLEFAPVEGTVTAGDDPTPFAFFLPDSSAPGSVIMGSLEPITMDGPVTLDVLASPDAVLNANWGKGVTPVPFFVTGGGGGFGLKGSFPYDGGPVTIEPRVAGTPYTATEFSLEATTGSLTSDGSAAPFASLSENTAQKWAVNSSAGVTIDGPVVLGVLASPDATLSGLTSDGTVPSTVHIWKNNPELTNALVGSYPFGGGPIILESTNGPVVTRGLDLTAEGPGGVRGFGDKSPAPYSTLDPSNSIERWRVSSDTDVVIDGRVKLDVEASSRANIKAVMTDGTASKLFNVSERPHFSLSGSYPFGGGPVTLSARRNAGTGLHGIELIASQGTLTGGGSAAPFESLDVNEANQWSVSSTAPVTLDGDLTLDVVASDNADIQGAFDDGYEPALFSVNEARPPISGVLLGTYPMGGGPITIKSLLAPVISRGIEISSVDDALSSGGSAAPFENLTSNTARQWSANSATDVTIDGSVTLDVSVAASSSSVSGASNSSEGWSGFNVDATLANNGSGLQGTFPSEGGPITVSPIDGPVATTGLQIKATEGTLTQGVSAKPFAIFLPNNRTPNTVTWGNLVSTVIFDGPVTLGATASADAVLEGQWGDGVIPTTMQITQEGAVVEPGNGGGKEMMDVPPLNQESIDLAIEDLAPMVLESQLVVLFPEGGGPLTLMATNGPVETLGVEFVADAGSLIHGDSAGPFQFFIGEGEGENPEKVVLGSLGVPVVIDEPITLDIFASADAVLTGAWGEGALGTFQAFAVTNVVPEPNGQLLIILGALGLLTLRRRAR